MSMSRMGMLLPMNSPFPARALSVSQLQCRPCSQLCSVCCKMTGRPAVQLTPAAVRSLP